MLPLLLPVRTSSNILLEVLRLGSESPARRTENFHANIPSTWIDSGEEAPSPEWHNLLRAIDRRHPRARTNHATDTHQVGTPWTVVDLP